MFRINTFAHNFSRFTIILGIFLCGCVPQMKVKAPPLPLVRPKWEAIEEQAGEWIVVAVGAEGEKLALAELCEPHRFICEVEPVGQVFWLKRVRK